MKLECRQRAKQQFGALVVGVWFVGGCASSGGAVADVAPGSTSQSDAGDAALAAQTSIEVVTTRAVGSVDRSEIGGKGLAVHSTWDDPVPLTPRGRFEVAVSAMAPQALLIRDDGGALRGLALSFVDTQTTTDPAPLRVDAKSTALALVMLVQGINPQTAARSRAVASEIAHTDRFPHLVVLLRDRLGSSSVVEQIEREDVAHALGDVTRRWFDTYGSPRPTSARPGSGWNFGADVLDVRGVLASIEISNYAPRYINLYRRSLTADGSVVGVKALAVGMSAMRGPGAFASGTRTTTTDIVDLRGGAQRVEYWAAGLGLMPSDLSLPSGLDADAVSHLGDALALTFSDYVMDAWVRWLLGVVELPAGWMQTLRLMARRQVNFTRLMMATSEDEALRAMRRTNLEMMDLALRLGALYAWPGLGAARLVFGMIRRLQAIAELFALGIYYRLLPLVATVSVPIPTSLQPSADSGATPADGGGQAPSDARVDAIDSGARSDAGSQQPAVGTFWRPVFSAAGPMVKHYRCSQAAPCGQCPVVANVWLLPVPGSLSLSPIDVQRDGDAVAGQLASRGQFGTFQIEDTQIDLQATVRGDQIDVVLSFAGKAAYASHPSPFTRAGRWEGRLVIEDALIDGNTITGDFSWNASVHSVDNTCSSFAYGETNQGTARICIDDCV